MSTLKVANISNLAGTVSVTSDNLVSGTAKAWVNFNGTGTVAIRAQFNVTSITDNGVGDYTVNFTTALTDANYCPVVGLAPSIAVSLSAGSWHGGVAADASGVPVTKTTSALRIRMATQSGPGGSYDTNETNVAIFR